MIGQYALAITSMSFLKKRIYFYLSVRPDALSSILKIGLTVNLLKPQLNSIRLLLGTISVFSVVLLILKCFADILHSCGNNVDTMIA